MQRRDFCLAPLAALAACAAPMAAPDAALQGRVWDTRARRFIGPGEARALLAGAQVALLGETHDNPVHHEIQRSILERMVRSGRRPALAMEQIDTEWQDDVDRVRSQGATAQSIERAGHVSHGWSWPLYAPLVTLAIESRLPIVALNLSRERTRRIIAEGFDALGNGEARRLALDRTWNGERNALLRREIVEGHCGEDSPIVDKLVDVQRAKDAVMADRILAHAARGVAAILGRGPARRDLDVPLYLVARAPQLRVLSLGLTEVDPDARTIEDYADAQPGRFDLVWFTPRAEREDPCASFKGLPAAR
jgi:uncharacterized iron-regulated protein